MQDHVLHCMYVKKCQQKNSDEHESEQEISKEHNNIFMVCSHGSCDKELADCWMLNVGCWNSFILDNSNNDEEDQNNQVHGNEIPGG